MKFNIIIDQDRLNYIIEGRWVFPNLPHYSSAIVNWSDGRKFILTAGDVE